MVKVKRITAVFLVMLTLLATCFIAMGCPKDKKYVTIKVVCWNLENGFERDIVEEWIFTPDISELRTVREYDGNQYRYAVFRYEISDPSLKGTWYTPSFSGASPFRQELFKLADDGSIEQEKLSYVCDKGEYVFRTESGHLENYWDDRSVILHITIE